MSMNITLTYVPKGEPCPTCGVTKPSVESCEVVQTCTEDTWYILGVTARILDEDDEPTEEEQQEPTECRGWEPYYSRYAERWKASGEKSHADSAYYKANPLARRKDERETLRHLEDLCDEATYYMEQGYEPVWGFT